jgi:epsilon-lactone hydrolase
MASAELSMIVGMMKSRPRPPVDQFDPVEARSAMEAMVGAFPVPADVLREPIVANGVPAEWVLAPKASRERTVLYLHGGGYVIGSINTHRELASRISSAADAQVLVIDYRLAPEHPHPAALDDATAAYRWLLDLGVAPERLVVAGDSAGGGLTVATLLAIRDAGIPLAAAGVCLSPWVDLEGNSESMTTKADADPMVFADGLRAFARMYLAGGDPRTPLAAPLHADLTGLPPLLIQVGTAETLLDDSTRLADRARAAGVDVTLEIWDDMIHVFQAFAPMLPEGRQAIEKIGEFVRRIA